MTAPDSQALQQNAAASTAAPQPPPPASVSTVPLRMAEEAAIFVANLDGYVRTSFFAPLFFFLCPFRFLVSLLVRQQPTRFNDPETLVNVLQTTGPLSELLWVEGCSYGTLCTCGENTGQLTPPHRCRLAFAYYTSVRDAEGAVERLHNAQVGPCKIALMSMFKLFRYLVLVLRHRVLYFFKPRCGVQVRQGDEAHFMYIHNLPQGLRLTEDSVMKTFKAYPYGWWISVFFVDVYFSPSALFLTGRCRQLEL